MTNSAGQVLSPLPRRPKMPMRCPRRGSVPRPGSIPESLKPQTCSHPVKFSAAPLPSGFKDSTEEGAGGACGKGAGRFVKFKTDVGLRRASLVMCRDPGRGQRLLECSWLGRFTCLLCGLAAERMPAGDKAPPIIQPPAQRLIPSEGTWQAGLFRNAGCNDSADRPWQNKRLPPRDCSASRRGASLAGVQVSLSDSREVT
jgi:hypothetical protein